MAKKRMSYEVASKTVSEIFANDIAGNGDPAALRSLVIDSQRRINQVNDNEDDDAQLAAAREVVKDLADSYKKAREQEIAKIVVLLRRLSELGE